MRQSLIYLGAWLWRSGMGLSAVLLFVFALLVIHLGITRIVVQTGPVFVRATMSAQSFTTSLLGTASLSSATLTSLAVSFSWTHTVFLFMPALAHAVKLHCDLKLNRRHVIAAILSAFAVAAPVSIYVTLALGYELGAENFKGWAFMYGKSAHYESIVAKMRLPAGVDWPAAVQYALGA